MTLALGRPANLTMPSYRTGCKPGHLPLRFRGDDGACFRCGRQEPPLDKLGPEQLALLARRKEAPKWDAWKALDEAIAQAALKLRALALLDDIDIEDAETYALWLTENEDVDATLDHRLREHDEHEVRWAIKAAYV